MHGKKGRQYQHRQIRTTNGWLVIGEEYRYEDGTLNANVQLLRDRSTDDELKFRLEVLSSNAPEWPPGHRLTITADWEGSGSWKLLDTETGE